MEILNLMTCGSVDDGKSTLLGRLIYETDNLLVDQSRYLEEISKKYDNAETQLNYALLLDGLIDEKEQGITIDIAFKYIILKNKIIRLIDSPGHTEFTKNMANAATHATAALVLVDASKGITSQTQKHIEILNLFNNISHVIFCINKMDLIHYSSEIFTEIKDDLSLLISEDKEIEFIPISALKGENITSNSKNLTKFDSKNILGAISNIKVKDNFSKSNLLLVKNSKIIESKRHYYVENFGLDLEIGETIYNTHTGEKSNLIKMFTDLNEVQSTKKYKNLVIVLDKEISVSKGDFLSNKNIFSELTDSIKVKLIWCSDSNLIKTKRYIFKFRNKSIKGFVSKIDETFDVVKNSIATLTVELQEKNILKNYKDDYFLSSFQVIDEYTFESLAFGYVDYKLDRGSSVLHEDIEQFNKKSKPCVWLTGLPSSGKSTIAKSLGELLSSKKIPFYILDGDNLRLTINKDLGFSESDRLENNRRIAHISKILSNSGVIPIVATVSPLKESRDFARSLYEFDEFNEVFINTPLEECINRDKKNLYASKNKVVKNITGIDAKFDIPENPELEIDTTKNNAQECAEKIFNTLKIYN